LGQFVNDSLSQSLVALESASHLVSDVSALVDDLLTFLSDGLEVLLSGGE